MSWVSLHRRKGESDRAFFTRELLAGTDREFVATATVDNTFYCAVRSASTGEVRGGVIAMERHRGYDNFSYKAVDETMGPTQTNAPAKILAVLTPTDSEYALEWRQECRATLEKRADAQARKKAVTAGVVIQVAVPLSFANGLVAAQFECVSRSGQTFRWNAITEDGTRFPCRLGRRWAERHSWEIAP